MRFLNEQESNALLRSYGISMVPSFVCTSEDDVRRHLATMDGECVMKVLSADLLHKSDAGAVRLGITGEAEALTAYREILDNAAAYDPTARIDGVILQRMLGQGLELILGVKKDAQFGHVVLFGTGGVLVEVMRDVSLRLVPLDARSAEDLIDQTKISKVFGGFRGTAYDKDEVRDALLKLSRLVEENPEIAEIDINPYVIYPSGEQGYGLDALIGFEQ